MVMRVIHVHVGCHEGHVGHLWSSWSCVIMRVMIYMYVDQ